MSDRGSLLAGVPDGLVRPLGIGLQVVAVLGVVLSLVGGVVGWRVVGAVDRAAVQSAEVTAEALGSLGDTLEVAAALVDGLDGTLAELEDALRATRTSFGAGADALDSVAQLSADAAPALASATATLRTLEDVGDEIDGALGSLSSLPFGLAYDPDSRFGATIGDLAADLEPLSASFADTADELADVSRTTDVLETELAALTDELSTVAQQLEDGTAVIGDYRTTAERVRVLADDLGGDLGADLAVLRVLLVLGSLVATAAQTVPWLLGRTLLVPADTT